MPTTPQITSKEIPTNRLTHHNNIAAKRPNTPLMPTTFALAFAALDACTTVLDVEDAELAVAELASVPSALAVPEVAEPADETAEDAEPADEARLAAVASPGRLAVATLARAWKLARERVAFADVLGVC